MMSSAQQGKSNNPPPWLSKDSLDALSKLTEDKFASLEARIVSVEYQINKHHEQFIDMIKDVEQKANSALSLATSNSKVIVIVIKSTVWLSIISRENRNSRNQK